MKSARGKSSAPVRHHGAFWDRGPTSPTLAAKLRVHVLRTKLDQLVAREYDAKLARKRHRKAAMRARFTSHDLAGTPICLVPRKYPAPPPPPVSPDNDVDMDEREDGEVLDDDDNDDNDSADRSPFNALRDRIRALDATLARLQHLEMMAISHMVAQAQAEPRPPVPPPEPTHELAAAPRPHSEHVAIPLPPVPPAPPARAAAAAGAPTRKPLALPPPPSRRPDRVPRSRLPSSSSTSSITALPPSTNSAGDARSSPALLTISPAPSPHSEPTLERVLFGSAAARDPAPAPALAPPLPVQTARPAPLRRDPSSSSLPLPARPPAMARDRDRDRDRDRPLPRAPHAGRRGPNTAAPGAAAAAAAAWGQLFPGAAPGGGGERRGGASARRADGAA
ncbi:hypothetical protein AMAG_08302 [Allomyces macrogynus ATCC 38327]|uniref:Uncharacterized protein n=1 Tax=Allomyces macrogynus (strain ATCC 38327) TaxID=578462 RepID=A0A0L0SL82_ALLM3|nr:hypothetical protein AMAG_08302 [Allomyces macrogynus ATCC 38327]|eukprot:KNE63140.1 hypothetical protein AMAG_08302 [Allomyces macrogynus ATCC 38327]